MSGIYTVRLVRPVFQSLTIEVQAWSRASAERKAVRRAAGISDSEWSEVKFDDASYEMHVESVLDHQEAHETFANPHREIRAFRSGGNRSRYLLLAADPANQVGFLLTQPWYRRADRMTQADLCCDWNEPISFVIENDGVECDEAVGDGPGSSVASKAVDMDNVIEFPVSDLDREMGGANV